MLLLLEGRVPAYRFWNSSAHEMCLFFLIYSYQYELMDILFYTLDYNPVVPSCFVFGWLCGLRDLSSLTRD